MWTFLYIVISKKCLCFSCLLWVLLCSLLPFWWEKLLHRLHVKSVFCLFVEHPWHFWPFCSYWLRFGGNAFTNIYVGTLNLVPSFCFIFYCIDCTVYLTLNPLSSQSDITVAHWTWSRHFWPICDVCSRRLLASHAGFT